MRRVRKKPVEVEAIQFTGETENVAEILAEAHERAAYVADQGHIAVYTLGGAMIANKGDWIIRGVQGEMWPCGDAIFRETYEMVE